MDVDPEIARAREFLREHGFDADRFYLYRPKLSVTQPSTDLERYQAALRSLRDHWREFGPEAGFDELIERWCGALLDGARYEDGER